VILPKKLQPKTEKDILVDVSKELKIPIEDVNRTFDIWLDYIDHIANDTDQGTIHLPKIGQLYVCLPKMRRGMNTGKWLEFKERKLSIIDKLREVCQYVVHDYVPIVLKYGVSRRDRKGKIDSTGRREFYTARNLINNQTDIFFEEDREFADNKLKYKKYFIDNEEDN
jgi:hypothetical protein